MINIFDNYNQESIYLRNSLILAGYKHKTVVINYNGFLPDDVTSPYEYFLNKNKKENPRYFNKITLPNFWEIHANGHEGQIFDYKEKVAHIHYADPKHKRYISHIDWLDKNKKVRITDYYDKYGDIFANSIYNLDGQKINTSYKDDKGKEMIVENHITGNIILNYREKIYIFKNKVDFLNFYLKEANINKDKIIYNSLANSFLRSFYDKEKGNDILFWQEEIYDYIPGNMKALLESENGRTQKIVVPNIQTYNKIISLLENNQHKEKILPLGYIYYFSNINNYSSNVLIFTNSDHIEHLEYLIEQLPDITFNIAAVTEMSSKLISFGEKDNVNLYPAIKESNVKKLLRECDIYLDINHHSEILAATRLAFENQLFILGFEETNHSRRYINPDNIYLSEEVEKMIEKLRRITNNKEYFKEELEKQNLFAGAVSPKDYIDILGTM